MLGRLDFVASIFIRLSQQRLLHPGQHVHDGIPGVSVADD